MLANSGSAVDDRDGLFATNSKLLTADYFSEQLVTSENVLIARPKEQLLSLEIWKCSIIYNGL